MAARRSPCFSANTAILLVLFVLVETTLAQVTFNRQWRRGKYAGDGKTDEGQSDEITFNRVTKSEPQQTNQRIITRLTNPAASIIMTAIDLGKLWKGSKNVLTTSYEVPPPNQQFPIYWSLTRNGAPLPSSNIYY